MTSRRDRRRSSTRGYIPVPVTVTVRLPPSLVIEIFPVNLPFEMGANWIGTGND